MFWGVTLETGKRYSQVVDSSYHLSMAALEPLPSAEGSGSKFVSVMIEHNKSEFLLCTLEQNRVLQVALDHCFVEGEEVAYFITGEGTVHLTGYIITDGVEGTDSDESEENEEAISSAGIKRLMKQNNKAVDEDSEDEDDEDWKPNAVSSQDFKKQLHGQELTNNSFKDGMKVSKKQLAKGKMNKLEEPVEKSPKKSSPKALTQLKKGPANKAVLDEESSDEEDEDFLMGDVDEEDDSGEDSDEEENSDWEDTDDEDEPPAYQAKKVKLDDSSSKEKFSGHMKNRSSELSATPQALSKNQEKGSSKKKQKQNESSPQVKSPGQKVSLDVSKSSSEGTPHSGNKSRKAFGGVDVQDTLVGNGPVAKLGKMVHVYYRGTFPNNKEFDSCTKGKAFSFRLGKSEVIKGWDVGIQGMRVGGKRKLIIPPAMGYGNKVSGPIPPNSTLHFEVELKAVS